MNRLQKRYEILKENKSIYDVCLDLKMYSDGISDLLSSDTINHYLRYLQTVLDTWELEPGGLYSMNFDFAIRNLIVATLELYNCK